MKIKEKLKSTFQIIKKVFEKNPVTIISILLFSAFTAITMDTELITDAWWQNIILFTLYFVSGTFLVEAFFYKNDPKKVISCVISAMIAIVFVVLHNYVLEIEHILWKIAVCYVVTLWILSIYFRFKKVKKDFTQYFLKVSVNMLKTSIIYGVLTIGITIVSSIFVYLIWEEIGYILITRLQIILLGFYYIPKLIYCLTDVEGEVNVFFKGLIKYVLTGLVMISFIIIYMYMIKILILRDMPKNQIFRILSALFIIGMPIWTMTQYFKDESLWYKISLKLPIAFIPFILLQIYTIGTRIADNGFTPLRYVCVALVIFEIIYSLMYILKKEKIEILLLIFNAIVIVSLIIPGINMFKISDVSQAQRLKIFKNKSDYTEEEKEKIYGAYRYLKYSPDGEKYINKILESEDIEIIKTFHQSETYNSNSEFKYINASTNMERIDIREYSNLYFITSSSRFNNMDLEETFKEIELKCEDFTGTIEVNVLERFKEYINTYMNSGKEELERYFDAHHEIEIDNSKKLIIKSFYLNYNSDSRVVKNYSIKGYWLEK